MGRARDGLEPAGRRRKIVDIDADGRPAEDSAKAVQGEVLEYDARARPARRRRFFLDRSELPWLPVSEPAFLLWVFAALFVVWLGIGAVLGLT